MPCQILDAAYKSLNNKHIEIFSGLPRAGAPRGLHMTSHDVAWLAATLVRPQTAFCEGNQASQIVWRSPANPAGTSDLAVRGIWRTAIGSWEVNFGFARLDKTNGACGEHCGFNPQCSYVTDFSPDGD